MTQTEINIPGRPVVNKRVVPQTANTLPDIYVGARRLLRNSPWMQQMAYGFLISSLLIIPYLSVWYVEIYHKPGTWIEILSETPHYFETFRWSIMFSLLSFAFYMTLTAFTLAPIATKYFKSVHLRRFGQLVGTLRYNLAYFASSLISLSIYLNSGINAEIDWDIYANHVSKVKNTPVTSSDVVTGAFDAYRYTIVRMIMKYQEHFKYIPYLLVVLATILLIQKIIILYISHNFHKSFYTKRIKRNNLVLSCFETLSISHTPENHKAIKPGAILKTELIACYASAIFKGLLKEGRDSLVLEDFMEEIDHPIATQLFAFLDFNRSGDISSVELEEAMLEAYEEKRMLLKAIKANERVLDRIETFFITLIIVFKLTLIVSKVNISIFTFLGYVAGSALLLRSTLDHLLEQFFGSLMHFLVAHPYDVGDKIQMKNKNYRIKDMGFWKTTLITSDGQVSYVPNYTLFGVKFGNYRRSDRMETNIMMAMNVGTSQEDIKMYTAAVNEFIKENGRYLDEHIVIKEVSVVNADIMAIVFGVTHKFNFNNDDNFHYRCELIFKNMARIAQEQNLKYVALRFQDE